MKTNMSNRSAQGTGSQRTPKPLVATAAAIGVAGLVLAGPGAVLLAAPQAQAAPVIPAPQQLIPGFDFLAMAGSAPRCWTRSLRSPV